MELNLDASANEQPSEDTVDRLGLVALTKAVVLRPHTAMSRLVAHPDRRWLIPLAAMVIMTVAATVAAFPARKQYEFAVTLQQLEQMEERGQTAAFGDRSAAEMAEFASTAGRVTSLIGAVLSPVIALLLVAAVLHFLGTVLGGQQTFTQMLSAISWARIPLILQAALRATYLVAGGHYDPYTSGLEGLVAPAAMQELATPSPWQPILAQLSVWNLWMLALFVIAVRVVSRVSLRKALMAVGAYLVLVLLLGEAGVGFGRFMAGFASSFEP